MQEKQNGVAKVLYVMALVILIGGVVGSIILGYVSQPPVSSDRLTQIREAAFGWDVFLSGAGACVIASVVLFGLSEGIELLHRIHAKLEELSYPINKLDDVDKKLQEIVNK